MIIVTAHGRLARAPELKDYNGPKGPGKVCRITIASDKRGRDGANFLDCTIFGKRGEAVAKYFNQGDGIAVTGTLDQNNYTDKNGNKRTSWALLVDDWEFAEKKGNGAAPAGQAPAPGEAFESADDEDIPF